ncbi:host attachment protein [Uliginosibacterium sp. H1]|uniref:host attachment protein n=1 Tax=Uliginosibacterium sp. H1 TaxID=3114757 RepID=UPI002E178309|nr:host attachment protein [Uliginosibacterium sp. H1]
MHTTWVIAADASRARIFELEDRKISAVHTVKEFEHKQGRAHIREINTDADGRFGGRDGQSHVSQPAVDAAQHEMDVFSKIVGDYLDKAAQERRYERLWVLAPPKLLGLIRQNLGKKAAGLVEEEIAKDISWFDERDIQDYLRRHATRH